MARAVRIRGLGGRAGEERGGEAYGEEGRGTGQPRWSAEVVTAVGLLNDSYLIEKITDLEGKNKKTLFQVLGSETLGIRGTWRRVVPGDWRRSRKREDLGVGLFNNK